MNDRNISYSLGPNFFCFDTKLMQTLDKIGVPPNSKWSALILYMRSINDYSFFTSQQKSAIQKLVLDVLKQKDFSELSFQKVARQMERILFAPWNQKLQQAFKETVDLVERFKALLSERTKDVHELEGNTIGVVQKGLDLKETVEEIKSKFAVVINQMEQDQHDLVYLSKTDHLTGLYNRRALDEFLSDAVNFVHEQCKPLSLLMIDIDHFKVVNDKYGHRIGDQALCVVATRIKEFVEKTPLFPGQTMFAARFGGEEFVVVCSGVGGQEALEFAEQLRQNIEDYNFLIRDINGNPVEKGIKLTVSIGVACLQEHWECKLAERLLEEADQAMYLCKQSGRNQVRICTPLSEDVQPASGFQH